ncbi:hypothetical protein [Alicycliphilus denitrificans]|uniref:hypothetical protein n=1 Tax=Alicycliphilus denitrificans TaxID=179636 RepID=UPI0001DA0224|nr:hypothetical protein [Alicycliphilus denitrificans]ADU99005.1 hypothetical protein Alide_1244 [Alicycliphilus denitrificans BC]
MRVKPFRVAVLACAWVGVGAWANSAAMVCAGMVLALVGLGALVATIAEGGTR